jgi:D-glycero-alpha-D-manno-heptose-7-phosphate kinase
LGSSSSFTVGLLNVLKALEGQMVSKRWLADEAIRIEQDVIKEHVGSQDQIWAAYGGLNRINFNRDGNYDVSPLIIERERREQLMGHMLLFFTGFSRFASTIAEKKIANMAAKQRHIRTMVSMVDEAQEILSNSAANIRDIGHLLHESWALKRELADAVTTPEIDAIYEAGRDAGALGGKLLGAGGGGFFMFFVEPDKRQAVIDRLNKLIRVNFDMDFEGSKIVVYEPELEK